MKSALGERKYLEEMYLVQEHYPCAYKNHLVDGSIVWCAEEVLKDADDFFLCGGDTSSLGLPFVSGGEADFYLCKTLRRGDICVRVFAPNVFSGTGRSGCLGMCAGEFAEKMGPQLRKGIMKILKLLQSDALKVREVSR